MRHGILSTNSTTYLIVSALFVSVCSLLIWRFPLRFGIEFAGGVVHEVRIETQEGRVATTAITAAVAPIAEPVSIIGTGESQFRIEFLQLPEEKQQEIEQALAPLGTVKTVQLARKDPALAPTLQRQAVITLGVALLSVLVLIGMRFKSIPFALASLLAAIHDLVFLVAVSSVLSHVTNFSADMLWVIAIVTGFCFSTHDTLVILNRLRELQKIAPTTPFPLLADQTLQSTIVRSLRMGLLTSAVLLSLVAIGPASLQAFGILLFLGVLVGMYSSFFVVLPLLTMLRSLQDTVSTLAIKP